jgi:glycosyltransferase involved in cell wall biosynthesis
VSRPLNAFNGVYTFQCIDAGEYSRQADWPNPFLSRSFSQVQEEFAPNVVHSHNYLSLGDNLLGLAKAQGAAVVYTLHDYGLICPNNLLLRRDGALCDKADPEFFAGCCPQLLRTASGRRPLLASQLPSLARWRMFADRYPPPPPAPAASGSRGGGRAAAGTAGNHRGGGQADLLPAEHPAALLPGGSVPLPQPVPAPALSGLRPAGRAGAAPALRHEILAKAPPPSDGRLRFGYIGAFHAHKGIGVLLEAFARLGDRASLHLHGFSFGSPVSDAHFRKLTSQPGHGVVVHARYDYSRIGELLADLDAVIVPTVWFENEPLTIQEAQIAGVPVITGNQGGMTELVRDGIDGVQFRLGDPHDLRRVLLELIAEPQRLQALREAYVHTIATKRRLI